MSRPRAADDFATIHARLAELRRERELAAREAGDADGPGPEAPRNARGGDSRYRPDKSDLPGLGVGRRYLPARQR